MTNDNIRDLIFLTDFRDSIAHVCHYGVYPICLAYLVKYVTWVSLNPMTYVLEGISVKAVFRLWSI